MNRDRFEAKYSCEPEILDKTLKKYPYFLRDDYTIRDSDEESLLMAYYEVKDELREKAKDRILLQQYNVPMSSTNEITGYETLEHCGLVFGQVVIKTGFLDSVMAGVENLMGVLEWDDSDQDSTSKMMNRVREYAIRRMKKEAIEKGGNAIIGVRCESATGNEILHIAMYGTAVKVRKIEE